MQQTGAAIAAGFDVYYADGEKLGTVAEIGRNYALVQKGTIFMKDIYVPFSAVTATDPTAGNVALGIGRDDIADMGWDVPPPYEPPARARSNGDPDISIFRTQPLGDAVLEGAIEVRPEATLA